MAHYQGAWLTGKIFPTCRFGVFFSPTESRRVAIFEILRIPSILIALDPGFTSAQRAQIQVTSIMSDSDLSDAPRSASIPSDSELEQALRRQVRNALEEGNGDDASITVSSMRKAAEEALGLDAGFYKSDEKWKEESKRIVHEAFVR